MDGRAGPRWALASVAALTALAFVLRFSLSRDSLIGDEIFLFKIVDGTHAHYAFNEIRNTEKTPPGFFYLVWLVGKIADPVETLRYPSVFFGTALVPMVYALGGRVAGWRAGLLAAAMVTFASFAIFYGSEARAYSALAFLSAASTFALLRALDTDRRAWWAAYGLAVLSVAYTHYMGVFVIVLQALWAFWVHREHVRTLLVVHGIVVLLYVPWIPGFLTQNEHSQFEAARIAFLAPPSVELLLNYTSRMLFGNSDLDIADLPGTGLFILALTVVALAAIPAAIAVLRAPAGTRPGLASPVVLLGLLAVATPIGVLAISLRPDRSFLLMRNLSASYPALVIGIAVLVVRLRRPFAPPAGLALLGVLLVGTWTTMQRENRRGDYKGAAAFIDRYAKPGDPVLQAFFVPAGANPAPILTLNFKKPHPYYVFDVEAEQAEAWAAGRRGASVFKVTPLPGVFAAVKETPLTGGPGNAFVRVRERRFVGLETVFVTQYRLRGR